MLDIYAWSHSTISKKSLLGYGSVNLSNLLEEYLAYGFEDHEEFLKEDYSVTKFFLH